jgi:xanthine dehydrogenase accessory factor
MTDDWVSGSELRGPSFVAPEDPPVRLLLVGAVPLAAGLTRLSAAIGWRATVIDPRARFASASRFPGAAEVRAAWPTDAFAAAGGLGGDCAVLALAHDPVLDDPALIAALASPAFFVGAMGSRRTQAARRERLSEAGVPAEQLARLAGPLGLDLGARTVGETAVSALAEVVAAHHGRSGGRLSEAGGAIHADGR